MNLSDLETLRTVAHERSFSRAAAKLHRTQPAVSLAIRRLEETCGEALLDRSRRDVKLTDAGELAVECAERMTAQRDRLHSELLELRGKHRGRVTVGANESTVFFLLPVLERFRARYPNVKVEVQRSLSRNIPTDVLDGNQDLGVVAYDPQNEGLQVEMVYHDRLVFVVYSSHPLAKRAPGAAAIELRRLGRESFIAHNVDSPYRAFTVNTFRRHRVPLNIVLEMPTIESIKYLVERGMGVAFVPRISVERELEAGELCEVPVKQIQVRRPLRLLARKGRLSHAAQAFLEEATTLLVR